MKSSKRALIYFLLSGVVVLAGGSFGFYLFSSLGDAKVEVARLKSEARNPEELKIELDEAKAKWEESGIKLAHLEKGIPEVAYVPTMLKELETFGKANGVNVFGVRPFIAATPTGKKEKKKKQEKPYTELSIEIKGKGRFRSVLNFVKAMTAFPKIVAVRTVTLMPKFDLNAVDKAQLEATIELRAFLFKPAKGEEAPFPVEEPKSTDPAADSNKGAPANSTNPGNTKATALKSAPRGNS